MHIRQISILAAIAGLTALGGLAAPGPAMAAAERANVVCGTMTNMADPPLVISGVDYNSSHSNTGNRIVTVPVGIAIEGALGRLHLDRSRVILRTATFAPDCEPTGGALTLDPNKGIPVGKHLVEPLAVLAPATGPLSAGAMPRALA